VSEAALIEELLHLATEFALEAGALLRDRQPLVRDLVATKSTPTDMVTEVDRASEELLVRRILAARPHDAILGEEGANHPGTSGVRWVIDPLDGTTNYIYGYPAYAVSVGIEHNGEPIVGAVFDAARSELFAAARGRGATLDARPIAVSTEIDLTHALVGTGFAYDVERRRGQAAFTAYMLPRVRDIRRGGSAAIDLCSVACGRLDAYAEFGLNEWDRSAGMLIVNEAGGRAAVKPGAFGTELNIAANPALFDPLHTLIHEALNTLS
jgi:fructose-1,6-bisphosphatase/inositol monophosphatase family enzyme